MSIFRRKPQPDLQVEVTIRIEGGDWDHEAEDHFVTNEDQRFNQTKADIDALPETQ